MSWHKKSELEDKMLMGQLIFQVIFLLGCLLLQTNVM